MLGCGLGVVTLTLVGGRLDAWSHGGFALAVLLAGFVASASAAAPPAWREPPGSPWPALELAGGVIVASLAALHLVEVVADVGGPRPPPAAAAGLAVALTVVAGVLCAAALQRAPVRRGSPVAWLGALGAVACVVGLGLGLTLGARAMGQLTGLTMAATLGAAVAVVFGPPRPARALGLGLALLAALTFWGLAGAFARSNFGRADQLFFAIHLAGLVLVVVAAGAATLPGRRR